MPPTCNRPSSVYSWFITSRPRRVRRLRLESSSGKKWMPSWCMPACFSCSAALLLASGLNAGPSEMGSPQAYSTSAT